MARYQKSQKKLTQKQNAKTADVIIIGAGLSGLYLALRLKQAEKNRRLRNPPRAKPYSSKSIVVLEASDRIGGRIHTVKRSRSSSGDKGNDDIQYEAGAARFSRERHQHVWSLMKEFGLANKAVQISNNTTTVGVPASQCIDVHSIITGLDVSNIPRTRAITLLDIIREQCGGKVAKRVEQNYHYYAELGQLGWWDAYQLFTRDFAPDIQYYSLGGDGGLSQLPYALCKQCQKLGVKVHLGARISERSGNKLTTIDGQTWQARHHIIYACPGDAIVQFDSTIGKQVLDKVQPTSLYRIYAGDYPVDSSTGKVWFDGMDKMSVAIPNDTPLKFVIPISSGSSKGGSNIMISYTDSKYADAMFDTLDAGTNNDRLYSIVKKAYPNVSAKLLRPGWVAHHYWSSGAGFWRPGTHSDHAISQLIGPHNAYTNGNHVLYPTKIWIAGENVSTFQGWMEGALQSANKVLSRLLHDNNYLKTYTIKRKSSTQKKIQKNQLGGVKEISKKELSRHNKKSSAWLAINGIVYDVTNWIDKHPGGDIIMKGIGKDATAIFKSIRGGSGHPAFVVDKILPKYKIGTLST